MKRVVVAAAVFLLPSLGPAAAREKYSLATWFIQTGDESVRCLALAPDRSVLVGGTTGSEDWLVRKYSPEGILAWKVAHDGAKGKDELDGIAVSREGLTYAVGSVYTGDFHAELLCINGKGKVAWQARFPEPSIFDCVAVFPGGGVVVGGYLQKQPHLSWLLCRYDKSGKLMWKDVYECPTNLQGSEFADSIAVSPKGNIVAAGYDRPAKNGAQDGLVRMYSPEGKVLWSQEYGSPAEPSDEGASGVAFAPDGDVVVVGSQHRPDLDRGRDWMIRKYAPDGRLVWSYVYNSPANGDDVPYAVDVDADGQILVGGWEGGSYPEVGRRWLVQVYDRDGNLVWGSTRKADENAPQEISAVKFDRDGSLLAGGGGFAGRFARIAPPEGAPEGPLRGRAGTLCVAVADLAPRNASAGDAAIVSDWIRTRLAGKPAITLVERGEMGKILAEQSFQQSGCTERDCAVKMGRLLNAQVIIVGSFGKFEDRYVVNVRAVRVDNGKVLLADEVRAAGLKELDRSVAELSVRLAGAIR